MESSKIAEYLLKIKAVEFRPERPFTWASGWKSPIYCDNRKTLSYPQVRKAITDAFVQRIKSDYPGATAVAGVATGGIAQAALVADVLDMPMIYVRSKPKGHGLENMVEGQLDPNAKYVVIEDLVSTGGSSAKAVSAILDAGGSVVGTISIFSYGFPQAEATFAAAGTSYQPLTTLETMLAKAEEIGYLSVDQMATIQEWSQSPSTWGT